MSRVSLSVCMPAHPRERQWERSGSFSLLQREHIQASGLTELQKWQKM